MFDDAATLVELNLDGNPIARIDWGTFRNLTSLETLSLERTALTRLGRGTFRGLDQLEYLSLRRSTIETIEVGYQWREGDNRVSVNPIFRIVELSSNMNLNIMWQSGWGSVWKFRVIAPIPRFRFWVFRSDLD